MRTKGGEYVAKKRHGQNCNNKDWHHCLFQKRHWKTGWAKVLRENSYCGAMIPKDTLHRFIHAKVHDIPLADGKSCRIAVETINTWLQTGHISLDDPIDHKLEVLIGIFQNTAPNTAAVLRKQLEIVRNYQQRPP